jgi:steroid delta-isomerase-like uncharacterized protein
MTAFTKQWLDAWNGHDIEKLVAFHNHHFGGKIVSEDFDYNDTESVRRIATHFLSAFPDLHFDLDDTVEYQNKVALLWVANGTHKGKYNNIPPTGKKLQVKGTTFFELKDGKIIKETFLWDGADLLRQMGLLPEVQFY